MKRRTFLTAGSAVAASAAWPALGQDLATVPVRIEMRKPVGALPHIWAESVGSDRAAITLREGWRRDLDRWRAETGVKRVRFHGIFNDELGVYAPSTLNRAKDSPPNFQNIDEVYDGLLAHGVSPLVELGFMPNRLASGTQSFGFYNGNVTPPTSNEAWSAFIKTFVVHLIERYGLAEVRRWPFEVWNEPNLPSFWTGTQGQYFEMYKATSVAIKSIDPKLQVGGPVTSSIAWLPEFLGYCAANQAPVDFVATHVYAGDNQRRLFGERRMPQYDVIPEAMALARQQIDASPLAGRPLWLTEWSSDSPAMIAHIIKGCLPTCQLMSQWTLSMAYEELGVSDYLLKEGDGGFGMMVRGIPKASFNSYKLLHALGETRLAADGPALASRRADGSTAALVWNLADVPQPSGIPGMTRTRPVKGDAKRLEIELVGARPGQAVRVRQVDQQQGSPLPAWRAMGSPQYPTREQLVQLRKSAEIAPARVMKVNAKGRLVLDLPPEGLALLELS